MWSQREPLFKTWDVVVKFLHRCIDTKSLYQIFSNYGPILSCEVAQDKRGMSKGYGFIHFETEAAANKAVEKGNGTLLNGKKIYVGHCIPKNGCDRELGETPKHFTNVYVKNFRETMSEDELCLLFEKYGAITSCRIMSEHNGKSKGFGFVAFEMPAAAEAAVIGLNGQIIGGKPLYVGRAQKKAERQQELKCQFEAPKQGLNLYVKNLDLTIDDERLIEEFAPFGTITSAKVMVKDGRSKGFGFVCFSSPEEATKAIAEMYGRTVGTKPLYVALAQRKEDRKAHLTSQYLQRVANIRKHQKMPFNQPCASNGFYTPKMPIPQRFYETAQAAQIPTPQRWPTQTQAEPEWVASRYKSEMLNDFCYSSCDSVQSTKIGVPRPITGKQPLIMTGRFLTGQVVNAEKHMPNSNYTPNRRSQQQGFGFANSGLLQPVLRNHEQRLLTTTMYE